MTNEDQDRMERRISELMGLHHPHTVNHDEQQAEQSDICVLCGVERYRHNKGYPRWTRDEAASAKLREILFKAGYHISAWPQSNGSIVLHYGDGLKDSKRASGKDWPQAIAIAFVAYAESLTPEERTKLDV